MQIFETYSDIPEDAQSAVVAIGNFDGVHRGHQKLLAAAGDIARDQGRKLAVLTFEPHPHRLFYPDEPPARLTPFALKAERLAACGVDSLFALSFDWAFASRPAAGFIDKVLKNGLKPAHVVVGYDFRFGQLRKGCPEDIESAGIPTTIIQEITDEAGAILSSSRIRQYLRHGKISQANAALGWDWEIRGEIVHGDRRGRELGYPTANVPLHDTIHPAYGVYASLVRIEGEQIWRPSATNIGIRPMFEIPTAQVESFIFDFDREIYGQVLHIRPLERLRGEAKFDNLEDLIAQIAADCAQAKEILGV